MVRTAKASLIAVTAVLAGIAALYLSGAMFLAGNKRYPFDVGVLDYLEFWRTYSGDAGLRRQLLLSGFFATLLCCIVLPSIIALGLRKKRSLHGSARFANRTEIRRSGLLGGRGILVGKLGGQFLALGGQQFALLAAPTRSGKGVGVVIPNLLQWPDSVMVLDIKGENFDITAGFRARHGQRVFAFRPFDEQGRTHRYNPLLAVRTQGYLRVGDLQAIAAIFYPTAAKDEDGNSKFFNDKARDLFVGLSLYLMDTPEFPFTLGELLRQSSAGKGTSIKDHLQNVIAARDRSDRPLSAACVEALDRFLSNSEVTLSGILATFTAPLAIFADPVVDAATSASDFSLAEVRSRRLSIYLVIPPPKLPVAGLLLNLMYSQLIDLNTRELPRDQTSLKYQCLLLMDEFTAMGRVTILSKGVGYIAGYNLRFLTIVQSIAQLASVYGKEEARAFSTNHALQILYAPKELEDAKEYSEMLGTFTEVSESRGKSRAILGKGGTTNSTNTSEQRRALMLPQELRELGVTRQIVVMENCKPILCEKIRYYEDGVFKARLYPPPVVPGNDIDAYMRRMQQLQRTVSAEPASPASTPESHRLPQLSDNADSGEIAAFVDDFLGRAEGRRTSAHDAENNAAFASASNAS